MHNSQSDKRDGLSVSDRWAGGAQSAHSGQKGVTFQQGQWDGVRFLNTAQNGLQLVNCLFLEFSIYYFKPWLITCIETMESESADKAGLPYSPDGTENMKEIIQPRPTRQTLRASWWLEVMTEALRTHPGFRSSFKWEEVADASGQRQKRQRPDL